MKHVPGSDKGERNGRPFRERPGLADGDDVDGPRLRVFGEAALGLVADDVILIAATVEALIATIAVHARLARRDQHALARLEPPSFAAHLGQDSGDLTTADMRHWDLGRQALP